MARLNSAVTRSDRAFRTWVKYAPNRGPQMPAMVARRTNCTLGLLRLALPAEVDTDTPDERADEPENAVLVEKPRP